MRTEWLPSWSGACSRRAGSGARRLELEEGPVRVPVDLASVDRDRDLYGTVVDLEGDPVPGACVEALGVPLGRRVGSGEPGGCCSARPSSSTTTAADRVLRLPVATWAVRPPPDLRAGAPPCGWSRSVARGEAGRAAVLGEERRLEVPSSSTRPVSMYAGVEVLLVTGHYFTRLVLELGPIATDGAGPGRLRRVSVPPRCLSWPGSPRRAWTLRRPARRDSGSLSSASRTTRGRGPGRRHRGASPWCARERRA